MTMESDATTGANHAADATNATNTNTTTNSTANATTTDDAATIRRDSAGDNISSDGEFSTFMNVLNSPSDSKAVFAANEDEDEDDIPHNKTFATEDSSDDDLTRKELGADAAVVVATTDDGDDEDDVDVERQQGHQGGKQLSSTAAATNNDDDDDDAFVMVDKPSSRCHRWAQFASTFLFVIGSILYLIMAVEDYKWAHELLDMPMSVRTADDDLTWVNYRLEERYNASLLEQEQQEQVQEQEAAANVLGEEEVAAAATTTKVGRAGGVRRMKTRQLFRMEEEEEEMRERRERRRALREAALSKAQREEEEASSARELVVVVADFAPPADDPSQQRQHRELQTPEELYYCLCWSELPEDIQEAYEKLGMNEDAWDNGNDTELSTQLADMWWQEVPEDIREAASFIGYTEEMWNVDEDGNPISPPEPTAAPVAASDSPTNRPSTKPVTDSPTDRPSLRPVTDSPTRRPTPIPTNDPTPPPVINSPAGLTSRPTTFAEAWAQLFIPANNVVEPAIVEEETTTTTTKSDDAQYWLDLTTDQRSSLAMLGYTEVSWNSGESAPVDTTPWDDLTTAQRYGAFVVGYDGSNWDDALGEHFPYQPAGGGEGVVAEEDVASTMVVAQTSTSEPSRKPTEGPTQRPTPEPSKMPTEEPSLSPVSSSPTSSPVTDAPTSAAPVPATLPTIPDPTLASAEATTSDATSEEILAQQPTPEELYYDEYWKDLPQDVQAAYSVLGVNETIWNKGLPSESDDYWWRELPPAMLEAATFLGYTEELWCVSVAPTGAPTPAQAVQEGVSSSEVESPPALPVSPSLPNAAEVEALSPVNDVAPILPPPPIDIGTEPRVPDPGSPEALYYDEYWKDLPPDIQAAYSTLGVNETIWNQALPSKADDFFWSDLPADMLEAATFIGYNEEYWCTTLPPTPSPGFTNGTGAAGVSGNEPDATAPGVAAGTYDDYGFDELPPHIQDAATTLGYDQLLWDMGGYSWAEDTFWDELTPEQKEAAALLGYDRYSWDYIDPVTGKALAMEDDYISYDDDYVFQVGASDIWVSQYQILYFFAALSFLIVGFVDLIRERHAFHILMILAGFFGVLSSIYMEENIRLSNQFNCISVHFYLLEAITLFGEHKRYALTAAAGGWMKGSTMSGDLAFVLGSLIDVVLSYFYLFDQTADWDVSLMVFSIIAAVMWLYCSFVYMAAFFASGK